MLIIITKEETNRNKKRVNKKLKSSELSLKKSILSNFAGY